MAGKGEGAEVPVNAQHAAARGKNTLDRPAASACTSETPQAICIHGRYSTAATPLLLLHCRYCARFRALRTRCSGSGAGTDAWAASVSGPGLLPPCGELPGRWSLSSVWR